VRPPAQACSWLPWLLRRAPLFPPRLALPPPPGAASSLAPSPRRLPRTGYTLLGNGTPREASALPESFRQANQRSHRIARDDPKATRVSRSSSFLPACLPACLPVVRHPPWARDPCQAQPPTPAVWLGVRCFVQHPNRGEGGDDRAARCCVCARVVAANREQERSIFGVSAWALLPRHGSSFFPPST
jgi:hypothetical protein